jgi:CheY-like chemotaxis protein
MVNTRQYQALVVEDWPVVRQATMRALSRAGFHCDGAPNGSLALEMVKAAQYDVVVTDLRMPEINGHQLTLELLAMPHRPAIIILTGAMEPALMHDLQARGVEEILFKPVALDAFAAKVQAVVEGRAYSLAASDAASEGASP